MLTKPDIPDELIIFRLQEEYDLRVASLTFLPIGADVNTAVYRVVAKDGTTFFLKLRKGFNEITVTVPRFLKSQGLQEILSPFDAKSQQGWADFGEYKMILYPFIEGKDGFDAELSDHHKQALGVALKAIHSVQLPQELKQQIPQESFSPQYRQSMRSFQSQVDHQTFSEPFAAKLSEFMHAKRAAIHHLIERAETLDSELHSQSLEFVLCHTDIHGGNMLIGEDGSFYIVDWDNPLLAPKERDLMFIGGGVDWIWQSPHDEAAFYTGYGNAEINFTALAYYRYERIIQDLVAYCEFLLASDEGGADREPAYETFKRNFEPGQTIEIAQQTDVLK